MTIPIQVGQFASLSNGTRLHYASAGEKGRPLMLFVHGFPEFWYEGYDRIPCADALQFRTLKKCRR